MEDACIFKHLVPFDHSALEGIERRVLAVVHNTGVAHGHSFLEIVGTKTVASFYYMRNIEIIFAKMHKSCITQRTIRHTGNILHIIAHKG